LIVEQRDYHVFTGKLPLLVKLYEEEGIALQQEQDVNERLITHSRALVDRWLHYLRSVLGGTLYTATGGTGGAPGGRSLDRSA